jgi:hypothetical protein
MPAFSRSQARVAAALVERPRTMEELRRELGLSLHELEGDLAKLIKLKVVQKEGYPTKYFVIAKVRDALKATKMDKGEFKAHFIVEGQSRDKKALQDANEALLKQLRSDKVVKAANIKEEAVEKDGDYWSTLFEADVSAKSFEDMMYAVLNYGPSSLELLSPREFSLSQEEAQGILMDVATSVHAYAQVVARMQEEMKEIRKRAKDVFITE